MQMARTCTSAIDLIKSGPDPYWLYIGTGRPYTDNEFQAGYYAISWPEFPRTTGSFANLASALSWFRPTQEFNPDYLFASQIGPFDIV